MGVSYGEFLYGKTHSDNDFGFSTDYLPDFLFDFQKSLVQWSVKKGRSAIFADCGLGKTPMQLVWSENVIRKTNRPVLILTPLAVGHQTLREAHKFDIEAERSAGGRFNGARIVITNYEKLHHFTASDFSGVVCDESSAIKSFNGKRRAEVTAFLRKMPYRLLCTATAAPNDYIELGTSSEALGEMGYMDMLGRFFKNDQQNSATGRQWGGVSKFRFKGHAEVPFWRWVSSWARAVRKPSDMGFNDDGFILPPLTVQDHVVTTRKLAPGMLFPLPAVGLSEEREERRRTIAERCERVAELVDHDRPAVVWCHLNDEGKRLAKMIPDCVEVSGSDSDEAKESAYEGFVSGDIRVLVIKPKIGAWGLNWQHCSHVVTFASHSYEQYYQSVRRCWRFGQERPVTVDIVVSEGEQGVLANLERKREQSDRMFEGLVAHMNDAMVIPKGNSFDERVEVPRWL